MAKSKNNNVKTTFLQINRDGYLYESSKEPKEDFKEIVMKDDKGNVIRKVYHKTYKETDDGYFSYIGIREAEFKTGKVKYLRFSIKSDEGQDVISIPLYTQRGSLSDYAKSLAILLPNVDFSHKVSVKPNTQKNDRDYTIKNFFIKDLDTDSYVKHAHKYGKDGDIPNCVKKESAGKVVWDCSEQDDYLYNILLKEIERFKQFKSNGGFATNETKTEDKQGTEPTPPTTTSTDIPQGTPQEAFNTDDSDPLPF